AAGARCRALTVPHPVAGVAALPLAGPGRERLVLVAAHAPGRGHRQLLQALAGGVDLLAWHRQHGLVDIGAARSGCDRVIGGAGVDQIAQCAYRVEHERADGNGHAVLFHKRTLPWWRAAYIPV